VPAVVTMADGSKLEGTLVREDDFLVVLILPDGTRKAMPVYAEASILELPKMHINGGRRGYLVGIAPQVLVQLQQPARFHALVRQLQQALQRRR